MASGSPVCRQQGHDQPSIWWLLAVRDAASAQFQPLAAELVKAPCKQQCGEEGMERRGRGDMFSPRKRRHTAALRADSPAALPPPRPLPSHRLPPALGMLIRMQARRRKPPCKMQKRFLQGERRQKGSILLPPASDSQYTTQPSFRRWPRLHCQVNLG